MLVEVVENHLSNFTALQLDDNPHARPIRLIPQVGNAFDGLFANEVGDALEQLRLVHLVGNLGDDDLFAIAFPGGLDFRLGADLDAAAAADVRLVDATPADDAAAGRKVWTRYQPDQLLQFLLARQLLWSTPVDVHQSGLDVPDHPIDHLAEVVRRDVGRHADGDARRAIDEKVWIRRRQHRRLRRRFVEIRLVVDRLVVEVVHQPLGDRFEPGFRVAIRRRGIAVDRAEVALAVDQGGAHVEVLRQADQRVVGGRVAVRVVVADDLANDLCALAIRAVRRQPHLPHRVQDAAVRGLQPVANVRQRPSDDDAHRVIKVRTLHLVFDVYGCSVNFHSTSLRPGRPPDGGLHMGRLVTRSPNH